MSIEPSQLLSHYGYAAVFIGSILEGETILLLAGYAAHRGYLSFPLVLFFGFLGGALGDQLFYFTGRWYGPAVIQRFPRLKRHVANVHSLIRRYHSRVIILVRFLYGLRAAGPMIIGSSGVHAGRFLLFNAIGAALWASLVAGAGYVFGNVLEVLLTDLKRYEEWAFLLLAAAGIGFALFRRHRQRKR